VGKAEVVETGTVVRFDGAQGYGFITPDGGGDDVFLHASVLDDDVKDRLRGGTRVEFQTMRGERGLKAFGVHVIDSAVSHSLTQTAPATLGDSVAEHAGADDELCDVLIETEFAQKITEVLIEVAPTLTGAQIVQVRRGIGAFARKHGWVEG
jgi:cold shock CspA family protein